MFAGWGKTRPSLEAGLAGDWHAHAPIVRGRRQRSQWAWGRGGAGSLGGPGVGSAGGAGAAPARREEVGTLSCPCVGSDVQAGSGGGRGGWSGRPSGRERGGEPRRASRPRGRPGVLAEARRRRQTSDGLVRRKGLQAESRRAAGAVAPAPQGGQRGRMSQEEILRKFIMRVQAMKDTDHNGEDNFASDFMVRGGGAAGGGGAGRAHASPRRGGEVVPRGGRGAALPPQPLACSLVAKGA